MKILVQNADGLKLPVQANEGEDAAYDVFATTPPNIEGHFINLPAYYADKLWTRVVYIEYGTNLFIAPESEETDDIKQLTTYHTLLFPRSSISKQNLLLANSIGLVDGGYRNQIFLRFKYIFQPEDFIVSQESGGLRVYGRVNNNHLYQQGDKIIQILAAPNIPIQFERITKLPESRRGLGGFGSSDKKVT